MRKDGLDHMDCEKVKGKGRGGDSLENTLMLGKIEGRRKRG